MLVGLSLAWQEIPGVGAGKESLQLESASKMLTFFSADLYRAPTVCHTCAGTPMPPGCPPSQSDEERGGVSGAPGGLERVRG